MEATSGRGRPALLVGAVAAAVAVAFADSSIVVLALPELYARFDASIEGVAWVITSYNLVVALGALALAAVVPRAHARVVLAAGSIVFLGASIACALAGSLGVLIAGRSVQGAGAALLLVGSPAVLCHLRGSTSRGVATWTMAGTLGVAMGPALGGILTQAFDWRSIFLAQAPIAAAALVAAAGHPRGRAAGGQPSGWRALPANLALGLLFGALVGALFLGVLLVIDVFGHPPIRGAAIVTLIPATALAAWPLATDLPAGRAIAAGSALLAAGLVGLALLPSGAMAFVLGSLALCGVGLGLSVPTLTHAALERDLGRGVTLTVGLRHVGLVLSIVLVAPLLTHDLTAAADVAELNATASIVDAEIPARTKIPLALDIRDALERAPRGEIPDLSGPFDEHGAGTDAAVRRTQDELVGSVQIAIARGFRRAFAVCALLAALALVPLAALRRRSSP
ncbi:MAG TPA: MFS transporter [Actinomycetota bacterium]|nr:MFS transporter [Actinomycetota bacterium]